MKSAKFSFKARTVFLLAAMFTAGLPAAVVTNGWDGGATTGFWTNAPNWSNNIAPANGAALFFPAGKPRLTSTNNAAAPNAFTLFSFGGSNYVFYASAGFTLTNGIYNYPNSGTNILNAPLTLGGATVLLDDNNSNDVFIVNSNVTLNGHTLQASPKGTVIMNDDITGSGSVTLTDVGSLLLNGSNTFSTPLALGNGTLGGTGYVPGITGTGGQVNPAGIGKRGTLHCTGDLKLNGSDVSLDYNFGVDQIQVNGNVTLTNCSLIFNQITPFALSTVVIIQNNGTNPVGGTFLGLPEGAIFTNDSSVIQITYRGNTSTNDVQLTVLDHINYVWDGGGTNNYWDTATNWVGNQAPNDFGYLTFPAGAARLNNTNQTISFSSGILFTGSNYVLNTATINMLGGITNAISGKTNTISGSLSDNSSVNFVTTNAQATLQLNGNLGLNNHPAVILGAGKTVINSTLISAGSIVASGSGPLYLNGNSTFTNTVAATNNSQVFLNGTWSAANALAEVYAGATLGGTGTVANVTIHSGGTLNPSEGGPGIISVTPGNFILESNSIFSADLNGAAVGEADQVSIFGNLIISNATLVLNENFIPSPGDVITLISYQGGGSAFGAFAGLPQGALFTTGGGSVYYITYQDGSGSDVAIHYTTVASTGVTRKWSGAVNGYWSNGGNWVGGIAPQPGDSLNFPPGLAAAKMVATNDFTTPSLINYLTVGGTSYSFYGTSNAAAVLAGGMAVTNEAGSTCNFFLPVHLTASQTFTASNSCYVYFQTKAPVSLHSSDLLLSGLGEFYFVGAVSRDSGGSGTLTKNNSGYLTLYGANSFGNLNLNNGVLNYFATHVAGSVLNLKSNATLLVESGSVLPALSAQNGTVSSLATAGVNGNFTLSSNTVFNTTIDFNNYLSVTGSVTLANAKLSVFSVGSYVPGKIYTNILNDGADAIVGTFTNLPEGSLLQSNNVPLRVSYVGGSGNDLTFTVLAKPNFTNTTVLGNKRIQLAGTGASGQPIVIEASTNLTQWLDLTTNSVTGGIFSFTDSNAPSFTRRFYRAKFQ
jgi:hypothetical protein